MSHQSLEKTLSTVRANPVLTGLITTAVVGLAWTINDYVSWKSFGTGGTPPTWAGYWRMTKLRLKAFMDNDDLLDTSIYGKTGPAYLTDLSLRSSPRPRLMPRILPQRQVPDGVLSTASLTRLHSIINRVAEAHPDVFEIKPSHTEGKTTEGLYAKHDLKTLNPIARDKMLDHEIGHTHPSDNSLHVWLSDRDATEVVNKGWGQRFCLPFVNKGWVMIYAPRSIEEVEVVERIVKAAARFISGVEV